MRHPLSTTIVAVPALLAISSLAIAGGAQDEHDHHADATNAPQAAPLDWRAEESGTLSNYVQLTSEKDFTKAGEAYFDPAGKWVIFQAVPRPADGSEPDQHYSMYVAKLARDAHGVVTGLEKPILISRPGSANTCGWFHPTQPWRVIFGSTLTPPADNQPAGYQRGSSRYNWQFPIEMDVVGGPIPSIYADLHDGFAPVSTQVFCTPVWSRPGYDAECSYSPDARFILYTQVDAKTGDGDLYIYDTTNQSHTPLVTKKGYDGGPFFSPDGKRITFRSDRRGDDLLQIYIADLVFDTDGAITGIANERQVTDNDHVNWAPFWDPTGTFLIYATSEISHRNYEVFAIEAPIGDASNKKPGELAKRRITFADGFDGLPVFSADGKMMMWTCQRGDVFPGEQRPSSQVWIAEVVSSLDPR